MLHVYLELEIMYLQYNVICFTPYMQISTQIILILFSLKNIQQQTCLHNCLNNLH